MVEYLDPENPALDETLSALADPTRRAIFASLSGGEKRVTEIAAPFDASLNAISKHIKKLEQAGLVRRRRKGREHFLSADPAPLEEAWAWIEAQRRFWNPRLDKLQSLIEKEADDG